MHGAGSRHPSVEPGREALPVKAATLAAAVEPLEEQTPDVMAIAAHAANVATDPIVLQMTLPVLQGVLLHRPCTRGTHRLQASTEVPELSPYPRGIGLPMQDDPAITPDAHVMREPKE